VIYPSRGTPDFWQLYEALPVQVKQLARKSYQLWSKNAFHPSLRFKRINPPNWSARIGDHYRVVGLFVGDEFVWQWIGTHESFNQRY
jgi:hypothetical protein